MPFNHTGWWWPWLDPDCHNTNGARVDAMGRHRWDHAELRSGSRRCRHRRTMGLTTIHKKKSDEEISRTQRRGILSSISDPLQRQARDEKVVGLSEGLTSPPLIHARSAHARSDSFGASLKVRYDQYNRDIPLENDESYARMKEERRPLVLFLLGYYTARKIFLYYLVSLSSVLTLILSVGLTIYWYDVYQKVRIHRLFLLYLCTTSITMECHS